MINLNTLRNYFLRPLRSETPLTAHCVNRGVSQSSPLAFNLTPCLMAMPLKKKRKIDPAIIKAREERRKRKIEKEIRYIQKLKKTLRPIEERTLPVCLYENAEARVRNVNIPEDVQNDRIVIRKEWCKINMIHSRMISQYIHKMIRSQETALEELRKVSEELYQAAIQVDENLLPFKFKGPSETPPIEDFKSPDGDFIDISKKWLPDSK